LNIRSITIGLQPGSLNESGLADKILKFKNLLSVEAQKRQIDIRTFRFTLPPLNLSENFTEAYSRSILNTLENLNKELNFRWFCVPFDLTCDTKSHSLSIKTALSTIKFFKNSFVNFIICDDKNINHTCISDLSSHLKNTSMLSSNGFDNFRTGISCNVRANTPFFPFSYHGHKEIGFSVAVESLEFLLNNFDNLHKDNFDEWAVDLLSKKLSELNNFFEEISHKSNLSYYGIDASFAPFPDSINSVASLIEKLGNDSFGANGTLYFTSLLTGILKKTISNKNIKSIGFNGVMYSLLEDNFLAKRNNQKIFTIDSLLLYSTLCGCGLDMIPVPGNILDDEISSLIIDTAAISINLKKPLGVRLLPIPTKIENQMTNFNYDFLVDTRIMNIKNMALLVK
jgi:uncharacterized protein (UPF0210 family)